MLLLIDDKKNQKDEMKLFYTKTRTQKCGHLLFGIDIFQPIRF